MQIAEMNLEEIEARAAEIASEMESASEERLAELETEAGEISVRREELKNIESRKAIAEALTTGEIEPEKVIKPVEVKENKMSEIEIRNSAEYGKAFVNYILTGKDEECRSLLSGNASGSVPVPEYLETEIKNAWEDCQIMSLVKKTSYKGNVKVGFELSATGAVVHTEGTDAPTEEVLTWGSVELKAESIKKWITVSDEAIDGTTIDTIGEIYKEVAQRIVEKAEDVLIGKITAAPQASTATACAVAKYTAATIAVDTITMALAELSGKAKNVTLVMNRRTYAAFKAAAKKNNYGVDPFDGCKVVYTDKLKAFSAATTGDAYVIAGDFGYGFQANFPAGNDITLKLDELSLAEQDLVKIVGRQYVGMGVVAPNAFVKIVK